jgi:hypothetical protein
MNLPSNPDEDRRTVPRELRDSEHESLSNSGVFGQRTEDAAPRRSWIWVAIALVVALAAAAWFWLSSAN